MLEPSNHGQPEFGGSGTVDHAVVERDRDVADRRGRHLAGASDRTFGDAPDAEDGHLGMVDDRRLEEPGELQPA